MGTFEAIFTNIRTLLDEVTSIQVKYSAPTFNFSGFPAAFVVPSGNENDFLTTNDNQRVYGFKIWVFTEYDLEAKDTSYKTLVACVDDVINKIDEQENPENAGRDLAANISNSDTLVAVYASPSRFALDEEEKLLGAEITIRCKVTVDITQI